MTGNAPRENSRRSDALASAWAPALALAGCILTSVHLVLGGTSSLALAAVNPLVAWPYILGFVLAVLGIMLHVPQPRASKHHLIITVGAGLLGILTLPIAWLYFGFAGIGAETDEQVTGVMAAFIAAVIPVVMVFTGGVISWRASKWTRRQRVRATVVLVLAAVAVSVGCLIFARFTFPNTGTI